MDSDEDIRLPQGKKDALDALYEFKIKMIEVDIMLQECINIFDVAIDNAWEQDDIDYDGNVSNLVLDLVGYRSATKVLDNVEAMKERKING